MFYPQDGRLPVEESCYGAPTVLACHRGTCSSSGFNSMGSEAVAELTYPVSELLRSKLLVLLDPEHCSNWRLLAEQMGITMSGITFLSHREREVGESPTAFLLDMWNNMGRSLVDLAQLCRDMGRDDAVGVVEAHITRETVV